MTPLSTRGTVWERDVYSKQCALGTLAHAQSMEQRRLFGTIRSCERKDSSEGSTERRASLPMCRSKGVQETMQLGPTHVDNVTTCSAVSFGALSSHVEGQFWTYNVLHGLSLKSRYSPYE